MTELETEVKVEKKFDRVGNTQTPNAFASRTFTNTVEDSLKKFDTYKPTDLNEIFNKLEKKTENAHKVEEDTDLDKFTRLEEDDFPVILSKTIEVPKEKMALKVNLRGKLIIFVASVAMALFLFLAIFNAVTISNLNQSISSLNQEIQITEEVVNEKIATYNALTDEGLLESKANNLGFSEMQGDNVHSLKVSKVNSTSSADADNENTNWFDKLCSWVAQLFGA